jgi:hypothetical protein
MHINLKYSLIIFCDRILPLLKNEIQRISKVIIGTENVIGHVGSFHPKCDPLIHRRKALDSEIICPRFGAILYTGSGIFQRLQSILPPSANAFGADYEGIPISALVCEVFPLDDVVETPWRSAIPIVIALGRALTGNQRHRMLYAWLKHQQIAKSGDNENEA